LRVIYEFINMSVKIWVDADACPNVVKEILFRAAKRVRIPLTLVANQYIQIPKSPFIKNMRVEKGFDVADKRIVELVNKGDLVITADIPLAAEAIERGAQVISPRGQEYDENNIRQRLGMRNFMEELRGSGENIGGPPALNQTDRQNFANALDRYLNQVNS
jgi:uncharacterized protein YaiI (UPF0178 family)